MKILSFISSPIYFLRYGIVSMSNTRQIIRWPLQIFSPKYKEISSRIQQFSLAEFSPVKLNPQPHKSGTQSYNWEEYAPKLSAKMSHMSYQRCSSQHKRWTMPKSLRYILWMNCGSIIVSSIEENLPRKLSIYSSMIRSILQILTCLSSKWWSIILLMIMG